MPVTKHHAFGPSSLERRDLCPASFQIEQMFPEEEDNEYSEMGDKLHLAAETEDFSQLDEKEKPMLEQCSALVASLSCEPGDKVYKELTMSLTGPDFSELCFGTADIVIVGENKLIVIDWKFGYTPVEWAKDNIQLATLAAMAMQKFGRVECEVRAVQPRIGRWEDKYLFTNCYEIAEHVEGIIKRTQGATLADLNPGDKQCQYCQGLHNCACPAVNNQALTMSDITPDLEKKISELTTEQLVDLYKRAKVVGRLEEKLKYRIKKVCEDLGQCGSLKLKTTSGGRVIKDITKAWNCVAEVFTPEDLLEFCTLSVAQLETGYAKKLVSKKEVKTQKEGKALFADAVGHLIKQKADKISIVSA